MNTQTVSKPTGVKRSFKLEEIWRIRTRLELEHNWMQMAFGYVKGNPLSYTDRMVCT